MSVTTEKKQDVIKKFATGPKDTGSAEVQVALLSTRISALTEHLKTHKKDVSSRRGLLILVSQRRRLLKYLSNKDNDRYQKLISALDIRG